MIITTNALVIKEQAVGESDKLVTLLTENRGVIRAFARKAKTFRDNKCAGTSLMSYSKMGIFEGKDKYIIESASSIEIFFELRNNIEILSLGQYFCELSALLVPEFSDSQEFLRLVLNSLSLLCKQKKSPLMIKAVLELRMLSLAGFMPNLVACRECACYENELWYFFPNSGDITCANCCGNTFGSIELNQTILTAMRYIIYSDFKKIFSFSIPNKDIQKLCLLSEKYTTHILGKVPMTLDFFKTINEENYG
ncbi:MAG: DNA repair protein RecO [Clostridia bacterium]